MAIVEFLVASREKIESEALTGLRGLAALHVVIFHCLMASPLNTNVLGGLEMPLFFLLSGYSLTLGYGRSTYDGNTKYCCNTLSQEEEEVRLFKTFDFFRNRFARLMPMYYFANFLSLPLCVLRHWVFGYPGWIPFTYVLLMATIDSIFPIGMILPILLFPFGAVGWTISTLWCFYLFFPLLLPKLQRYSSEKVSRWIVYFFWIQLIVGVLIGAPQYIVKSFSIAGHCAYWLSTGWGISRLPVFIMGILSALLRLRNHEKFGIDNRSFFVCYIYSYFPWVGTQSKPLENENALLLGIAESESESESELTTESSTKANKKKCSWLVDIISLTHIICCLLVSPLLPHYISFFANPPRRDLLNWVVQFLCVNSLLTVIDGLTRDGGYSILSMVCRSRPIQQLGRCSMTLYLIHEPLREWGIVITEWCTNTKKIKETPFWLIQIVVVVAIVMAWILTVLLEEPLKNRLRAPMNTTRANMASQSDDSAELNNNA